MRTREERTPTPIEALLLVPREAAAATRRALFRQAFASLGRGALGDAPPPLEGLAARAIEDAVAAAQADGLLDDLDWLAPEEAAVALYELASSLAHSPLRRDLGRRVLKLLGEGSATTFVALATRMALGGGRGLSGAGIEARIRLAMWLPAWALVPVDGLALALVSRRELVTAWIARGAEGSLDDRRLAGRVLERAASEVARRARAGDPTGLAHFVVIPAPARFGRAAPEARLPGLLERLLADRESLVWRHAAVARGVLAAVRPAALEALVGELDPSLGPTEWRRAATALAGALAFDRESAREHLLSLVRGPLVARDPGLLSAVAWGLERAIELEPEAAREVLLALLEVGPVAAAEAVAELLWATNDFAPDVAERFAAAVEASLEAGDAPDLGLAALARELVSDLRASGTERPGLRGTLRAATLALVEQGGVAARALAVRAHAEASAVLDELATALESGDLSRSVALLRELDLGLLESEAEGALLALDRGAHASGRAELAGRLGRLLESSGVGASSTGGSVLFEQRKLRALLHLVDARFAEGLTEGERAEERGRWVRVARTLAEQNRAEPSPSALRRARTATVARALDALVREQSAEPVDAALAAWAWLEQPSDLEVLAEATMHPEVAAVASALATFERSAGDDLATALIALAAELPAGSSHRMDTLRAALQRLQRGLLAVVRAPTLASLLDRSGVAPLELVDGALPLVAQLTSGALLRALGVEPTELPPRVALAELVASVLIAGREGGADDARARLAFEVTLLGRVLSSLAPRGLFQRVAALLRRLPEIPDGRTDGSTSVGPGAAPLPMWLPPRRTMGGFFVHKNLGSGALGSVFVATRVEERHDPEAERFALKVPDYDARAASTLSEAEFLRIFRKEATALLELPEHPNLPRFVTFDAGAKPKPILVMELVEGPSVERLVEAKALTVPKCFELFDGVLGGLEAMHQLGIGHLDLKPSNIIVRPSGESVLVDFGLAGRAIRPGCTTAAYAAPEVWGALSGSPLTADVYAFGCLAFEILTGDTLFEADTDVALVALHLAHDGLPPKVRALASDPRLEPVGMLLFECLRREPSARILVGDLRRALARLGAALRAQPWPLAAR